MKYRTGTIYSEITNKGRSTVARRVRGTNKQIYTSRWVGEIVVNYKRYRFRSTNFDNVRHWVDMMVEKYPVYFTGFEKNKKDKHVHNGNDERNY